MRWFRLVIFAWLIPGYIVGEPGDLEQRTRERLKLKTTWINIRSERQPAIYMDFPEAGYYLAVARSSDRLIRNLQTERGIPGISGSTEDLIKQLDQLGKFKIREILPTPIKDTRINCNYFSGAL